MIDGVPDTFIGRTLYPLYMIFPLVFSYHLCNRSMQCIAISIHMSKKEMPETLENALLKLIKTLMILKWILVFFFSLNILLGSFIVFLSDEDQLASYTALVVI
jgi:hypothetical protein